MDCATSEFQVGPLQSRVALAGAFAGFEGRVNGHKPLRPPTWSVARGPTLEDRDRLIVNKLAYQLDEPHIGEVVMLYYPNDRRDARDDLPAWRDPVARMDAICGRNRLTAASKNRVRPNTR